MNSNPRSNQKRIGILIPMALFIIQSYNDDKECPRYCSPADPLNSALVNTLNGENIFTNGIYTPTDIILIEKSDGRNDEFDFINENDLNIIRINTIGWKTETVNYSINI
jgi:hypothetical protein